MASTQNSRSGKKLWLIPVILVLGGTAIFLGIRNFQSQQHESAEQYRHELAQFGRREMGVPVLSPVHFARHGEEAAADIVAILESNESNDLAKFQAMETLLIIRGKERVTPLLIEQVEKQQPAPVREHAISLLGETDTPEAADFLIGLVDQPTLAIPALVALANLPEHAQAHQDKLISLLDHENRELASAAAIALGSTGTPEAQAALLPKLDSPLAQPAARGLARMGNQQGIDYLLKIIRGEQNGNRARAEAGLSEAGTPAEPRVEALLTSQNPTTVASALRILQQVGKIENQKNWVKFLESQNPEIRMASLQLLNARTAPIGGQAAFRLLINNPGSLSKEETELAERIARQAAAQDFAFYESQLASDNPAAQIQAIRVIAFSQDPRAIDLLIEGLSHESPTVREESAKSLGRLHGIGGLKEDRERVYNLISTLAESDPAPQVQKTARSLLIVLR